MFDLLPPHPETTKKHSREFKTLREFTDLLKAKVGTTNNVGGYGSSHYYTERGAKNCATVESSRHGRGWADLSFEATMDRIKNGWPEGAAILKEKRLEVADKLEATVKKQVWDVVGHSLDVGRMLTGEPECFRRRRMVRDEPKMLTMAMNMTVNYHETSESLLRRLAFVIALVDVLETKGCRVRIIACSSSTALSHGRSWTNATISFVLKDYHETMSSSTLATWCGTIEIERRLFWLYHDITDYWTDCGDLSRNGACNDKALFAKCDIWFPAWDFPPSEEVCRVWLYALGLLAELEWTPGEVRAYDNLKKFAKELDREFKERPKR